MKTPAAALIPIVIGMQCCDLKARHAPVKYFCFKPKIVLALYSTCMHYKFLYFLILVLVGNKNVSAQFIMAGEGDCTQFAMNYLPPLVIYASITNGPHHNFDINGDGIADFKAGSDGNSGSSYYLSECTIIPIGKTEIAWGKFDTVVEYCGGNPPVNAGYMPVPKVFSLNDTINANQVWQNNALYFSYTSSSGIGSGQGGGSGSVFSCTSIIRGLDWRGSKIIGIRIFTATDTLYGWIQFSPISTSNMSISGFACEAKRPGQISVNPNPVIGDVTVRLTRSTLDTEWQLYDQMGQTVMSGVFENITNYIETRHLSAGMYYLKTKYSTVKLIKVTP